MLYALQTECNSVLETKMPLVESDVERVEEVR